MAGINRLGKAPPKPGTLRPPDPNKYRTVDMFSEGAEGDMDYIKTVRDIEEMQQQQGWLFGRGAFDKADLLYLRDTMEQQRHMELELRDSERSQFATLRAQLDRGNEDHRTTGSTPAQRPGKREREPAVKVQPKAKPVVVAKRGQEKDGWRAVAAAADTSQSSAAEPGEKRVKAGRSAQPQLQWAGQERGKPADDPAAPTTSSQQSEEGGGLEGLLGGYGSDSDESDEAATPAATTGVKKSENDEGSSRAAAVALPSAADLLEGSKPVDSTLPKARQVDDRLVWTLPESPPESPHASL